MISVTFSHILILMLFGIYVEYIIILNHDRKNTRAA